MQRERSRTFCKRDLQGERERERERERPSLMDAKRMK